MECSFMKSGVLDKYPIRTLHTKRYYYLLTLVSVSSS